MSTFIGKPCTAFHGVRWLAAGPLLEVALAARQAGGGAAVLIFDDATGAVVDVDLRGSDEQIEARLAARSDPAPAAAAAVEGKGTEKQTPARRGRPKLGVVGREVTLLPRHWDWLAAQPGGASVALRRLVEAARRDDHGGGKARSRQERSYRFLSAMCGDLPGFEEAARALFAGNGAAFAERMTGWPVDLRDYALRLAGDGTA